MELLSAERKRNQRKSPLTPKKSYRKEDSPPPAPMRVGGRLKKIKIPFDPSDAVLPKRRQTEPPAPAKKFACKDGPMPQQHSCCHCKKCHKPELLVNCKKNCNTRIHLNCLQSIYENFGKNEELSWECSNCQSCTICGKGSAIGKLLKCYSCYSHYHTKCHGAEDKIQIIKENRFLCGCCDKKRNMNTPPIVPKVTLQKKNRVFAQTRAKPANTESNFSSDGKSGFLGFNSNEAVDKSADDEKPELTLPASPLMRIQSQHGSSSDNPSSVEDDTQIVDASEWSTDQVFKYFKGIFPKQAHVFRDHEIDGPSLYLLKRSDVVKGFNLNIGPALKIYSHILKLQTKCNDLTMSWQ